MNAITPRQRYAAPIWTLLLLAPFIAEVLSASTRASVLFVYIPEVMVWGVGALFARELVRRWHAGSVSLVLLGLALAVAEEFLIQQTSIAPLPFPGAQPGYARLWGINLVYLLFMLGFESIWVVVLPVQVTELFFPRRAAQPWLRLRGAILAALVFLLGCRAAWYGWTQQARPRLHAAPYTPPRNLIALGIAAIVVLIALAWLLRHLGHANSQSTRRIPPPLLAGLAAFLFGSAWFALISQQFVPHPIQPFSLAIASGFLWAANAGALFLPWSTAPAWTTRHRFAAAAGAILACMAIPYLSAASWPPIDLIGKIIFDALALIGLTLLARRIYLRPDHVSHVGQG